MERALESTACTVHYNLPQTGLDHTVSMQNLSSQTKLKDRLLKTTNLKLLLDIGFFLKAAARDNLTCETPINAAQKAYETPAATWQWKGDSELFVGFNTYLKDMAEEDK